MITPCGFNLYFHNGSLCWTFFPMLICHQCIPFSEISFHNFYPFSNWIICFLLLNWILRVLYVVEILVLCWIFTLWTFSPSLWVCLFIFLAWSFAKDGVGGPFRKGFGLCTSIAQWLPFLSATHRIFDWQGDWQIIIIPHMWLFGPNLILWCLLGRGTSSTHFGLDDGKLQLLIFAERSQTFKWEMWYVVNTFTNIF